MSHRLPIMESFYTIQGEGAFTGQAAFFIRLAGCDVGCVWCDVKESWEVMPEQWTEVGRIVEEATKHPARLAVITGGEPCLYDLEPLIESMQQAGFRVHIETSGTRPLKGNPDWICVSPKKFKAPLHELMQRADELKVIVYHESDLPWGKEMAVATTEECRLFLQPEYSKAEAMMPLMVDFVKAHPRWQISLQTHKMLGIP